MGIDRDFRKAYLKSQMRRQELPTSGAVFVSVKNRDKAGDGPRLIRSDHVWAVAAPTLWINSTVMP